MHRNEIKARPAQHEIYKVVLNQKSLSQMRQVLALSLEICRMFADTYHVKLNREIEPTNNRHFWKVNMEEIQQTIEDGCELSKSPEECQDYLNRIVTYIKKMERDYNRH